jgi:rRNA maturation protein Nop10
MENNSNTSTIVSYFCSVCQDTELTNICSFCKHKTTPVVIDIIDIQYAITCPWCKDLMYPREQWRKTNIPFHATKLITTTKYCCHHILCDKCMTNEIGLEEICPFCEEETMSELRDFEEEDDYKEYRHDGRGRWSKKNQIPTIYECNTCKYCKSITPNHMYHSN